MTDRQPGESDEELAGRIIDDFARSQPKYAEHTGDPRDTRERIREVFVEIARAEVFAAEHAIGILDAALAASPYLAASLDSTLGGDGATDCTSGPFVPTPERSRDSEVARIAAALHEAIVGPQCGHLAGIPDEHGPDHHTDEAEALYDAGLRSTSRDSEARPESAKSGVVTDADDAR